MLHTLPGNCLQTQHLCRCNLAVSHHTPHNPTDKPAPYGTPGANQPAQPPPHIMQLSRLLIVPITRDDASKSG